MKRSKKQKDQQIKDKDRECGQHWLFAEYKIHNVAPDGAGPMFILAP